MVVYTPSKKSPSRERYDRENPLVSVRLTAELRGLLDEVKGERSYADLVKEAFTDMAALAQELRNRNGGLLAPCSRCGRPMHIAPDSPAHEAICKYLISRGWRHKSCQR